MALPRTRRGRERREAFIDGYRAGILTLGIVPVVDGRVVPSSEHASNVRADIDGHAEIAWATYSSERP